MQFNPSQQQLIKVLNSLYCQVCDLTSSVVVLTRLYVVFLRKTECFNCPYGNDYFSEYAEELETSETLKQISAIAKQLGVYVIAGSIPTRDNESGKLFNTCTVFDREGNRVAVYHKVHLFDISIPDQITFKESDSFTEGDKFSFFEFAPNGERVVKVGLGISFDIRFPEMAHIYMREGCELLVYPGAFNMTTGPAHWELLCRARAVDNQLFVCVVSPARDTTADYVAYGHSMAVDPWGRKLAEFDEKAGVLVVDVEIDKCQEIRQQIPRLTNKRSNLYMVRAYRYIWWK